jgi:hypothetical protein
MAAASLRNHTVSSPPRHSDYDKYGKLIRLAGAMAD